MESSFRVCFLSKNVIEHNIVFVMPCKIIEQVMKCLLFCSILQNMHRPYFIILEIVILIQSLCMKKLYYVEGSLGKQSNGFL